MPRDLVVGNSGSGKSTLAMRLARAAGAAHLDLDTVAWLGVEPPQRRPVADSAGSLDAFTAAHAAWVIEGCYADLHALLLPRCTRLIFLEPGVEACIANARARPWEPHKYGSQEAQDANLAMLIDWIRAYPTRDGAMSLAAHRALYDGFAGAKVLLGTREAIAAFA